MRNSILSLGLLLLLAGCSQNLTDLRSTAKQSGLLLTSEQKVDCEVNNSVVGLTNLNARQTAVQLAVDGANCRDRVDSVLLSIEAYNTAIEDNEIFNAVIPVFTDSCEFGVVVSGTSENRVANLVNSLGSESNECARRHSELMATVDTFNATLN